ncbi:MAG: Na+/H+-dicarboxylate symporter [Bacteriovoracaceae bacterium]
MSKPFKYEALAFGLALLGVLVGLYLPDVALNLEFVGKIFILLLKMMIIPLVVTSIFLSIAKLKVSELKSLGGRTILYYLTTSSLACFTGLMIANSYSFTDGILLQNVSDYDPSKLANISFSSVITSFFSGNFFNALAKGNIVQIVVFTILIGLASLGIRKEQRDFLVTFSDAVQKMMMVIIHWIVKIAPIGIFSLLAAIVAKTETKIFYGLGPLFLAIAIAALIHTLITLPAIGFFIGGFNPFKFILKIKKALIVALTTASSTATLPVSTQVLSEEGEVKAKTTGFVLPLGSTLNMDGSALYQGMVILFLGEFAGMSLTLSQQFLVFFFVMTSSAGSAGIPGGGLMMFGAVMEMVGIPLEYIGVYLLIDRFWDYPITMVNVYGDLIGAKTIDRFIE